MDRWEDNSGDTVSRLMHLVESEVTASEEVKEMFFLPDLTMA